MDNAEFWKVVGQSAGLRADGVVAPVVVQFDRLDTNLEHLSRFRAANGDGPSEDVGAAELRLRPGVNGKPESGVGVSCGPPETVEIVTESPESTMMWGFSAASR